MTSRRSIGLLTLILLLVPLTAMAGGNHGYDKDKDKQITICYKGETKTIDHDKWYRYEKKGASKGECPSTTTMVEDSTTTLNETTTTPPTTSTTIAATTTTTIGSSTVTTGWFLEPYTYCADGTTWIGVEFAGFDSVYYWLEDPLGTADGQFFNSEAVNFGVLNSDTFFTFWGDGNNEFTATLNVPATDCDPATSTSVSPTTVITDPTETLPFTGEENGKLSSLAQVMLVSGLALLLASRLKVEDEDELG